MLILIYGSKGWIGQQVIEYLKKENINYIESNFRADNLDGIKEEINNYQPTHILSCIGRTHGKIGDKTYTTIDYLEQDGKLRENVNDNLYSPLLLARICEIYNIHFTYIGTGCIFEYDNEHPYGIEVNGFIEESLPNFFGSSYSVVKGFTDRLIKLFPQVLNLRIRMPITNINNPRNFITKITTYDKICSIPNSMTVLPILIPVMINMMKDKITGTYNFTNPGLISHNEILEMYRELVNKDFKWTNFTIDEQNKILASKRSNNYLETNKLESYCKVINIKDSVRWCLENWQL
jgi:dTDP-4-dehydrorhamnose reductase